jgi:hypothetical protein
MAGGGTPSQVKLKQAARMRASRSPLFLRVGLDDDREEADRELEELLGAVGCVGVEEQRVAGFETVGLAAVAVEHLALEQVDELGPGVLEQGEDLGLLGQGDFSVRVMR